MQKINIHGKQYETVASRLNRLLEFEDIFDVGYSIITKVISIENGIIAMSATIKYKNIEVTGHAMEEVTSKGINSTSAMENCETSAVGRALAHLGFFGTEFPSADEMTTALKGQAIKEKKNSPSKKQLYVIKKTCESLSISYDDSIKNVKTSKDASDLIIKLKDEDARNQQEQASF